MVLLCPSLMREIILFGANRPGNVMKPALYFSTLANIRFNIDSICFRSSAVRNDRIEVIDSLSLSAIFTTSIPLSVNSNLKRIYFGVFLILFISRPFHTHGLPGNNVHLAFYQFSYFQTKSPFRRAPGSYTGPAFAGLEYDVDSVLFV